MCKRGSEPLVGPFKSFRALTMIGNKPKRRSVARALYTTEPSLANGEASAERLASALSVLGELVKWLASTEASELLEETDRTL